MFRNWLFIISLFCYTSLLSPVFGADEVKIKWGKVPLEDLQMTEFPADSNAAAVVLADVGEVSFINDFNISFKRHRRIKILSEAGFHWADVEIPYYAKDNLENVSNVRGHTFKLLPNGKVKKVKMNKKSKFDEKMDDKYRMMKFTLPDISPGCIIEYSYHKYSKYPTFLEDWSFQTTEPVRWSEFIANIPSILEYVIVKRGIEPYNLESRKVLPWTPSLAYYQSARLYSLKIMNHRWATKDVPAIRNEPYMTTPKDYMTRIKFQLSQISWPGTTPQNFMKTWDELTEDLLNSANFGQQLDQHNILREKAASIVSGQNTPLQKIGALYDFVRTTMHWNGDYRIFTDKNLDRALQDQEGSKAEISLMLTSMLRSVGIDAFPFLSSTRTNGKILKNYPLLTQFDLVSSYVRTGSQSFILDATDPYRPYDLPPINALNGSGWIVDKEKKAWKKIPEPDISENLCTLKAVLSEDGGVEGEVEMGKTGYQGLSARRSIHEEGVEDYIQEELINDLSESDVDSFLLCNKDSLDAMLKIKVFFKSGDYAQIAGDYFYFNPVLFNRVKENPFKLSARTFPVDFAYKFKEMYTASIQVPRGYSIQEVPEKVRIYLPGNGGRFSRTVSVDGNQLVARYLLKIDKVIFEPEDYKSLREFFDRIVEAEADQVVLIKTDPEEDF
jgi:hypothetical protein